MSSYQFREDLTALFAKYPNRCWRLAPQHIAQHVISILVSTDHIIAFKVEMENKETIKEKTLKKYAEKDLKLSTQQITRFCNICNKSIFDHDTVITVQKGGNIDKQFHIDCWLKNNKPQV